VTPGVALSSRAWKGRGGRWSTKTWAEPRGRLFGADSGNARVLVRGGEGALVSGCR
jgi:hypothetical protein